MTSEEQLLRIASLQRRFINFDTDIKRLWKRASLSPQGYVGTPAAAEAPVVPVVTTLPPCSATCYYIWNIFSWSPYGSNLCASQGCVCSEPLTPGAFDGEIRAGSCSPPPTTTTLAPTTTTTTSAPLCNLCSDYPSGSVTVTLSGFTGQVSSCGADNLDGAYTFTCGGNVSFSGTAWTGFISPGKRARASWSCTGIDAFVVFEAGTTGNIVVKLRTVDGLVPDDFIFQDATLCLVPGVTNNLPLTYTAPGHDATSIGTCTVKLN
jgi:hypothetical protein